MVEGYPQFIASEDKAITSGTPAVENKGPYR